MERETNDLKEIRYINFKKLDSLSILELGRIHKWMTKKISFGNEGVMTRFEMFKSFPAEYKRESIKYKKDGAISDTNNLVVYDKNNSGWDVPKIFFNLIDLRYETNIVEKDDINERLTGNEREYADELDDRIKRELKEDNSDLNYEKIKQIVWDFDDEKLQADYRKERREEYSESWTIDEFVGSLSYSELNGYSRYLNDSLIGSITEYLGLSYDNNFYELLMCFSDLEDDPKSKSSVENYFDESYQEYFDSHIYDTGVIRDIITSAKEEEKGWHEASEAGKKYLTELRDKIESIADKKNLSGYISTSLTFDAGGSLYLGVDNDENDKSINIRISDHRQLSGMFDKPDYNISLQNFTNIDLGLDEHSEEDRQQRISLSRGKVRANYSSFDDYYPDSAEELLSELGVDSDVFVSAEEKSCEKLEKVEAPVLGM